VPELSFGTHFFQDLVENGIAYLPLYPDEPTTLFNEDFMLGSENSLSDVSPKDGLFAEEVRVIHVPSAAHGAKLDIAMDADADQAAAYLSNSTR
jgi:hypothetical protein